MIFTKAAESGILNNTRKTHKFVDMVAKISADKGVSFDFTSSEKLKESGFAIEGKTVNGLVTKDGIKININSAKALDTVVGHEITHILEGTELYTELQTALKAYAESKGEYQSRYEEIAKLYEGIEGANIEQELTADLVGDYLFSDESFVKNLSSENRNVFQKIYDEIKYLCKVTTAGSKEARQLEKVKKTFEEIYRETKVEKNTTEGVRYSLDSVDGIDFVKAERNIFIKEDGTMASEREIFNALVGKTIPLSDGEIKIVKRLPKKDMFNELSRRYPKHFDNVDDIKQLNSSVNHNMEELITNSKLKTANEPDVNRKHQKQGITSFDTRNVKFYDGDKAYDIEFSIAILQNGEKVAYAKKFYGYDAELTKKIQTAESRSKQSPFNQQSVSIDSIPNSAENVKQNGKMSLSSKDTAPKKYGKVYGEDVKLEKDFYSKMSKSTGERKITAPTRESIAEGKKKAITDAPMREDLNPLKNEQVQKESKAVGRIIKENISKISETSYFSVKSEVLPKNIRPSEYIFNIFKRQGGIATNKELGKVELNRSGAKSTALHGFGKNKLAAV